MRRRDFVSGMLAGAATTSSSASAGTDITAEITALLRKTEALWDTQDTKRLRDLWDLDDNAPFYLAGEQEDWFVGWDELNNYLAPEGGPKITQAIRVRFYNIRARLLAPDLAFAAYWMCTDMKLVFQPKPFASDNRVAAVFRRKPEGWRYLTYTEAFQAPNMYMNTLMEKDVADDYQNFFDGNFQFNQRSQHQHADCVCFTSTCTRLDKVDTFGELQPGGVEYFVRTIHLLPPVSDTLFHYINARSPASYLNFPPPPEKAKPIQVRNLRQEAG